MVAETAALEEALQGRLLIIAGGGFADALTEYVAHKISLGWTVDVADTATAGTTAAELRDCIRARYDDPASRPDALLLVGDTAQIPAFSGVTTGNPATDLYYACMDDGDDWQPEFPVGRFSVASRDQLRAVVEKTIEYETVASDAWMNHAAFIAGDDSFASTEETHDWVIDTYLTPLGYASDRIYEHTYGATTSEVRDTLNEGGVLAVYSGHGTVSSWTDGPPFSQSDVTDLTNSGMYPLVASFACNTGDYSVDECFLETWLRQAEKGAVACWGASASPTWTYSSALEKRLFEAIYDDGCEAFGAATHRAKELFLDYFGPSSISRYYFEMYNLLGDPTAQLPVSSSVLQIDGGQGDDVVRLVRDPDDPSYVQVFVNGESLSGAPELASLRRIKVRGLEGDDTLIVDSSNGLITLPLGIHYDGGGGSDEIQLVQTGGDVQTSDTFDMVGIPHAVHRCDVTGPGGVQTVSFEALEQIVDLVPAEVFNVFGGTGLVGGVAGGGAVGAESPGNSEFPARAITYEAAQTIGPAGGRVTIDGFERIEFSNKCALVVDAGGGPSVVNLDNPHAPTGLTGIVVHGGGSKDAFNIWPGPVPIFIDGKGNDDSVVYHGTDAPETVDLWADRGVFRSEGITVEATNVEAMTAQSGGGADIVRFFAFDSSAKDVFTVDGGLATLTGPDANNQANGYATIYAYGGRGQSDEVHLHDGPGNDLYVVTAEYAGIYVEGVKASTGYEVHTRYFDNGYGYANGTGLDTAKFYDSPHDDVFNSTADDCEMSNTSYLRRANSFEAVHAYATAGGNDVAHMHDGPGSDWFVATGVDGIMVRPQYLHRTKWFEEVYAWGQGDGYNYARLYDTANGDTFNATPQLATLSGQRVEGGTYFNQVQNFDAVHAYAWAGGYDVAELYGSPGADVYYGSPVEGSMTDNATYWNRAKYFEEINAHAVGEGDAALLFGSAGDDTYVGSLTAGELSGAGWSRRVEQFEQVDVEGEGGYDEAFLTDSALGDMLEAEDNWARLSNDVLRYAHWVADFAHVKASGSSDAGDSKHIKAVDYWLEIEGVWKDD